LDTSGDAAIVCSLPSSFEGIMLNIMKRGRLADNKSSSNAIITKLNEKQQK